MASSLTRLPPRHPSVRKLSLQPRSRAQQTRYQHLMRPLSNNKWLQRNKIRRRRLRLGKASARCRPTPRPLLWATPMLLQHHMPVTPLVVPARLNQPTPGQLLVLSTHRPTMDRPQTGHLQPSVFVKSHLFPSGRALECQENRLAPSRNPPTTQRLSLRTTGLAAGASTAML